jgi:uncharacterized membrane protein
VALDVLTEIEIKRPRDEVSAFASDPTNAPDWYKNIKAIDWETSPPAAVGSRIRFREDAPADATKMTLRNRGEPSGFAAVTVPVMKRAMRKANEGDLRRLRELLEH